MFEKEENNNTQLALLAPHALMDGLHLGPHYASAPKEEKAAKLRQIKKILEQ